MGHLTLFGSLRHAACDMTVPLPVAKGGPPIGLPGPCYLAVVLGIHGHLLEVQGRFDPELALEADDVAEAALLPLRTTALCVPKEMTLDTAQIVS